MVHQKYFVLGVCRIALFFLFPVFSHTFEDVTGLIDPAAHSGYMLVPAEKTTTTEPVYLKKTAYHAFEQMAAAAAASGIDLRLTSGRRSFSGQLDLFTRYGFDRALPPGTSSHHFGQALDFANTKPSWSAYTRLRHHARRYWFCQTYDGHSSAQEAESRHYEYQPEEFRDALVWYRDTIYLYLDHHRLIPTTGMSKQMLFDTYIYPISHQCIDSYPSQIEDPLTGIKFSRRLDSNTPDHLVYTLSRYKFPAGSWLLDILPPEIRFVKTQHATLQFAPLTKYPTHVQDLFLNYHQRFRDWVERFVLLRTYAKLMGRRENTLTYTSTYTSHK